MLALCGAGPFGTAGHCSGRCCSGADGHCVFNLDEGIDAQECCEALPPLPVSVLPSGNPCAAASCTSDREATVEPSLQLQELAVLKHLWACLPTIVITSVSLHRLMTAHSPDA